MDTEEAIANVKSVYSEVTQDLDEVIRLLKRGEKYEKMWKSLRHDVIECSDVKTYYSNILELEQKYFPKN